MDRIIATFAVFGLLLLALACGATEEPEVEPPRLVVAYVDEAGDVVIRGEPGGRSRRVSSDWVVFGMSWSPNAERLLITERLGDDWQIRIVEAGEFSTVGVVPLDERPGHDVTWRRDGAAFVLSGVSSAVAYSRTGRELWSIDRSGLPIGWSPDGLWFAFLERGGNRPALMLVTDGSTKHQVTGAALGLESSLVLSAGPWLIDGTMTFGDLSSLEAQGWQVAVSEDGVELGAPADPRVAAEYRRASEARDADGEVARAALIDVAGGPTAASGGIGGFYWVSARYDDADGHHRVFATRDGAALGSERITIDFGDNLFPQVVAAARAGEDDD